MRPFLSEEETLAKIEETEISLASPPSLTYLQRKKLKSPAKDYVEDNIKADKKHITKLKKVTLIPKTPNI